MKWLWPILRCYLGSYFGGTHNFSLQTGILTQGLLNTEQQCCQSCMIFSNSVCRFMLNVVVCHV